MTRECKRQTFKNSNFESMLCSSPKIFHEHAIILPEPGHLIVHRTSPNEHPESGGSKNKYG